MNPQEGMIAAALNEAAAPQAVTVIPMQQFSDFMAQLREDAAKQRQEARRDHLETELRVRADIQVAKVPRCDGANSNAVRQWFREIEMTMPYTEWTVYIAANTATGALRQELEHYLSLHHNREAAAWSEVREHLEKAFLSPHEKQKLRHELTNMKQGAYETCASFNRRFRAAADLAYPTTSRAGTRNEDQTEILLNAYIDGLRDDSMAERLVYWGRPEDLPTAMRLVDDYEADINRVQMCRRRTTDRQEEPMEIGAVQPSATIPVEVTRALSEVSEVKRQMSGLTQQFTKLMATLKEGPSKSVSSQQGARPKTTSAGQKTNYVFEADGTPVCNYCKRPGHVQRHCQTRKAAQQARAQQGNVDKTQGGQ